MTIPWIAVGAFLCVSVAATTALFLAGKALAVKARVYSPLKAEIYECGEPPVGRAWIQFHSRYYVVALVFVIFDVEAALLFPWALQARQLGMSVVFPGLVFVAVLMLGWLYALKKGALEWR